MAPANTDNRFSIESTCDKDKGILDYRLFRSSGGGIEVKYSWGSMPAVLKGGEEFTLTVSQSVTKDDTMGLTHRFIVEKDASGLSLSSSASSSRIATAYINGVALASFGVKDGTCSVAMRLVMDKGVKLGQRCSIYIITGVGIGMYSRGAEFVYEWQEYEMASMPPPVAPVSDLAQGWALIGSNVPVAPANTDNRFSIESTCDKDKGILDYRLFRSSGGGIEVKYSWGSMPAVLKGGEEFTLTVSQSVTKDDTMGLTHRFIVEKDASGLSLSSSASSSRIATAYINGVALASFGVKDGTCSVAMRLVMDKGVKLGQRCSIYIITGVGIGMYSRGAEFVYEWQDMVKPRP